jgi:hypothetical protein
MDSTILHWIRRYMGKLLYAPPGKPLRPIMAGLTDSSHVCVHHGKRRCCPVKAMVPMTLCEFLPRWKGLRGAHTPACEPSSVLVNSGCYTFTTQEKQNRTICSAQQVLQHGGDNGLTTRTSTGDVSQNRC